MVPSGPALSEQGCEQHGTINAYCVPGLFFPAAVLAVQVRGECVEAGVEEQLELVDPAHDFPQRPRTELVDPLPPLAPLGDQVGVLEHLEMLRNGRERDPEGFCQRAGRLLSVLEQHQDRPPRRMSDGMEHVVLLQGSRHFVHAGYWPTSSMNRWVQSGSGFPSSWASSRSRNAWGPGKKPGALCLVIRR